MPMPWTLESHKSPSGLEWKCKRYPSGLTEGATPEEVAIAEYVAALEAERDKLQLLTKAQAERIEAQAMSRAAEKPAKSPAHR